MIEKTFEGTLWASRFMVILAVVFGLIGAVVLFVVASFDIYETAAEGFELISKKNVMQGKEKIEILNFRKK